MIKVCGITRREDALAAVSAGADAIGFIFVPGSPRHISSGAARMIIDILPSTVLPVGVFANADRGTLLSTLAETGIRAIQLHGDESSDDVLGYPVPVIKAHHIGPGFSVSTLGEFPVFAHLCDTLVEGKSGGTGRVFDWSLIREAGGFGRIIVSGGLTPLNVGDAIRRTRPFGVDASSGLEHAPGVKDHAAVDRFVQEARRAFSALRPGDHRAEYPLSIPPGGQQ